MNTATLPFSWHSRENNHPSSQGDISHYVGTHRILRYSKEYTAIAYEVRALPLREGTSIQGNSSERICVLHRICKMKRIDFYSLQIVHNNFK